MKKYKQSMCCFVGKLVLSINSLTREEYKDGQLLISFDDEGV